MDERSNENARPRDELERAQAPQTESKPDSQKDFGTDDAEATGPRMPSLRPYLDAGLQLIPLHRWDAKDARGRPRGKTPRDGAWGIREYDSAAVAAAAEQDGTNVGVRLPASVMVLDVDPRNFGDGDSLLALMIDTSMDLRGVPHTATGSGGSHYWFSKPIDVQLLDSLEAYPGVEFKSLGRQVVAAGSTHPNGTPYRWTGDFDLRDLPELPESLLRLARRPVRSHGESAGLGELTVEQLAETLDQLDAENFAEHDEWLKLMMACHHATNGEGRQEFIDWSTRDPRYQDHGWIIGRRWDSLHAESGSGGRPITVRYLHKVVQARGGTVPHVAPEDDFEAVEQPPADRRVTLRHMCVAEGKKMPEANFPNCLKVLRIVGDEFGLAFDEFSQSAFLTARELPWNVDIGRRINDDVVRRVRQYLVEATGMNWGKDDVTEAVLTLVREKPYHPVRDYLDSLRWDGVSRLDTWLVRYAGATDNAYSRAIGAKTLLAAVRRVRRPGCKFDNVIVLEGNQGSGKSSLVKALVPNEEWFSDAPIGNTESKDSPLSLQGKWIIELGEMSVLSKSGVESLKAFVSCSVDRVRRPYARMHEELYRQCVFIGTTNQDSYLKDQTGNRRFWPIRVGTIALAALATDRDQLWAEAAVREAAGESLLLPAELWDLAAAEQEERVAVDPWLDILRTYLDGTSGNGPTSPIDRVHSTTLLTVALGIRASDQTSADAQRLKVVMTKHLGWAQKQNIRAGVDGKQGRGYQRP